MLLSNRHYRLLSIALAGMEVATYLPLLLLGWIYIRGGQMWRSALPDQVGQLSDLLATIGSPIRIVFVVLLLWLLYLLVTDLINVGGIETPRRELLFFGTIALSTLVLIRLTLYSGTGFFDLGWVANTISALFNFTDGWRAEIIVILGNLLLWSRVVLSLGRTLNFTSVGLSFRLNLLLALLGNAILYAVVGLSIPLQFFGLVFTFGLLAVGLARIDEKSIVGQHSAGALLSWGRMGLLGAATAFSIIAGLLLTIIYTPAKILAFLQWFSPLWTFLGAIIMGILSGVFWLLAPLLEWLIQTLRGMMEGLEVFEPTQETGSGDLAEQPLEDIPDFTEFLQEWTLVRYCLVTFAIVVVAAFLWVFFVRPYLRQRIDEAEDVEQEPAGLGLDGLRGGLNRLRDLAKLVGRFGLSLELLDAISIENMYANLGRIARQRGYPRQPNQPPDEYIHDLTQAFPNQADGLQRITSAYMRVHYGEQVIPREELSRLRELYQEVREAPAPIEVE